MSGHEVSTRCTVVLGGARVASNFIDLVAMRAVESDDGICRGLEDCACFVFHKDGVKVSTKAIAEEEEAGETADKRGMDGALIIDGQFEAGEISVHAGACGDCEAIAFGDGACRTVKVLEDAVDGCRT